VHEIFFERSLKHLVSLNSMPIQFLTDSKIHTDPTCGTEQKLLRNKNVK